MPIETFIKNFRDWFNLKPRLDRSKHKPPFFNERQIWWCSIGENIGSEASGKSNKFTRPVIIYTKLSKYTFLGIPTTTQLLDQDGKQRNGSWYQKLELNKIEMLAVLSQIRVFDYRRLDNLLGQIDSDDFSKIKTKFNLLYHKK